MWADLRAFVAAMHQALHYPVTSDLHEQCRMELMGQEEQHPQQVGVGACVGRCCWLWLGVAVDD